MKSRKQQPDQIICVLVKNMSDSKIYIKTVMPEYTEKCIRYDIFFVFIVEKKQW